MTPRPATPADVEELYRRHAREIHGYLCRRAGESGADLLGEVFVIALRRMNDLPAAELRRAWLFGTARRLLLAAERTTSRRRVAEHERVRVHDGRAGDASADGAPSVRAVREALASLKEPDRELIRLTEWEQLSIADAASVVGMRPGTARVRLHRARRALAAHPLLIELVQRPAEMSGRASGGTPGTGGTRRPAG
ncbi:RNA polymerase sigma factor [Aeromicrobium fastidiosum]|uniref:RNA polymerase sigma factor n=1 Tax=Aeromicrobium fastidiosum TaxID=52699 RepID=UPI001AE296C6|nr:sigma-70 family RNA polymerase sigma factor [Aeromicrobium fastidiosum]